MVRCRTCGKIAKENEKGWIECSSCGSWYDTDCQDKEKERTAKLVFSGHVCATCGSILEFGTGKMIIRTYPSGIPYTKSLEERVKDVVSGVGVTKG